jgi:uroporphyrinogen-III decarboxylase
MILINLAEPDASPRPWPYAENIEARIEWAAKDYQIRMDQSEWLDDDSVPMLSPYTGTEIFAEAFGSGVYNSGDNMPFARPAIHSAREMARLKMPSVRESTLERCFVIANRLLARCGTEGLVQLPDIQSPLDIAALIWEKADFLASMIEEPEAVKDLVLMTEALLTEFLDAWFAMYGDEYIAHYPVFPMKGGFTFSEDEVGEFSPAMFRQFCLPSINRLSRRYGGCSMHCCANSRHQWEAFTEIEGLRLLNLCQPQEEIDEAAAFFGDRVCHDHFYGIGHVQASNQLVPRWAELLPRRAHAVIEVTAHTREEAVEYAKQLREFEAERSI